MKRVKIKGKNKNKNEEHDERIRKQAARDLNDKMMLVAALAAVDEFGISDDQLCAWYERYARYSQHIKDKLTDLNYVQSLIERDCDVKLKGWTE